MRVGALHALLVHERGAGARPSRYGRADTGSGGRGGEHERALSIRRRERCAFMAASFRPRPCSDLMTVESSVEELEELDLFRDFH